MNKFVTFFCRVTDLARKKTCRVIILPSHAWGDKKEVSTRHSVRPSWHQTVLSACSFFMFRIQEMGWCAACSFTVAANFQRKYCWERKKKWKIEGLWRRHNEVMCSMIFVYVKARSFIFVLKEAHVIRNEVRLSYCFCTACYLYPWTAICTSYLVTPWR